MSKVKWILLIDLLTWGIAMSRFVCNRTRTGTTRLRTLGRSLFSDLFRDELRNSWSPRRCCRWGGRSVGRVNYFSSSFCSSWGMDLFCFQLKDIRRRGQRECRSFGISSAIIEKGRKNNQDMKRHFKNTIQSLIFEKNLIKTLTFNQYELINSLCRRNLRHSFKYSNVETSIWLEYRHDAADSLLTFISRVVVTICDVIW